MFINYTPFLPFQCITLPLPFVSVHHLTPPLSISVNYLTPPFSISLHHLTPLYLHYSASPHPTSLHYSASPHPPPHLPPLQCITSPPPSISVHNLTPSLHFSASPHLPPHSVTVHHLTPPPFQCITSHPLPPLQCITSHPPPSLRYSASPHTSPLTPLQCITYANTDNIEALVSGILSQMKSSIGISGKTSAARVLVMISIEHSTLMQDQAGKCLKALLSGLMNSRSIVLKKSFATTIGFISKVVHRGHS